MCGIAGAYHFNQTPVSADILERMTRSLAHRGPDDYGHMFADGRGKTCSWKDTAPAWPSGRLGMGSRRLKIIDLTPAGHQPMQSTNGRLWIVFNGEIYNYLELRNELAAQGHRFQSHTDTEVILHAFAEWGETCFERFNGMWGLAIYDSKEGSLVLSRDRWGVKPLYVYRDSERVVFGSEIKALLCHPDVPRSPNYSTVYNYLARHYRWVDGGRDTFYSKIEHLPPAHTWTISDQGKLVERRYWALNPQRTFEPRSDDEALTRFKDLFTDAVRLRLRSDVPVACMLSGGLDSSAVTCMAARLTQSPVTTFSARYAEKDFDEGPYIEDTIQFLRAKAQFIHPKPVELIDTLSTMLAQSDEPICTVTWFSHWLIMKDVAGMGFPVLLNGHAGDELFGGYWAHYLYNFADLEQSDPALFKSEYDQWMANHKRDPQEYPRFKAELAAIEKGSLQPVDPWTLYPNAVLPEFKERYAATPPRPNPFKSVSHLSAKLYDDLSYQTLPAALRPEDRNSMAFSIETRSPFLDYRLVEFAFSLPSRFKIRHGLGKWIIREGMKGILPEKVRTRLDKQGFNAPTLHWYRGDQRFKVRDILASPQLKKRGILDQAEILRLFDEHAAGKANHYMVIWQWINFELWMRQHFDPH